MLRLSRIDAGTIKLLRFPFSYFLMPVFLFTLSQIDQGNLTNTAACFFILHFLVYPASNGYNSYMDQDTTSIGGLEKPPKPTRQLFYASVILDLIAISLSLMISVSFFIGVAAYIIASKAYSYKGVRLKKFPMGGFITVVFFQGGFTFWLVYNGISVTPLEFNETLTFALLGCSFLIGGVYPLTQVYQHEADRLNGDITISYKLGVKGTFVFSAIMFIISSVFLWYYFNLIHKISHFIVLQVFLLPVVLYFIKWFLMVIKDKDQASFKNAMRMNFIASTCMNLCFILLIIFNAIKAESIFDN